MVFGLFSGGGDASREAAAHGAQQMKRGRRRAQGHLRSGMEGLEGSYAEALEQFAPYQEGAETGFQAYGDAVGLGGQEGHARAVDQFQQGPGYQFAMDQGLQQLDRRAASRGMLGSGNTNLDTINYAQGLANQEWQTHLDRLSPYLSLGPQMAGQQAGIHQNLGAAQYGHGQNMAGLDWSYGQGRANLGMQSAAAQQQADANRMDTALGGLSLGARLLGFM